MPMYQFFFFNDTPTTEIYTLSLHDALPIYKIYFTDYQSGNLGRLDPATGAVKMWPSPGGANSGPYGIAITPDGLVWYSESGVKPNTIIQFNPRTEQFARAAIPSGGGTVRHMVATADGRGDIDCSGVNK